MTRGAETLLAVLATLGTAQAQSLRDCDTFEANARNLASPVDQNVRDFANGSIRFITLDTGGEPACCSMHLMVLQPSPEDPGQICQLISHRGASGFLDVSLKDARAAYDPANGLTVRVPVAEYGDVGGAPLTLRVRVNQQTGAIDADLGDS